MRSITFKLGSGLSAEEQELALGQVRAVSGVEKAHSLNPKASRASIRRMCYAAVADSANIEAVIEQMKAVPGVETVEVPPPRWLMGEAGS